MLVPREGEEGNRIVKGFPSSRTLQLDGLKSSSVYWFRTSLVGCVGGCTCISLRWRVLNADSLCIIDWVGVTTQFMNTSTAVSSTQFLRRRTAHTSTLFTVRCYCHSKSVSPSVRPSVTLRYREQMGMSRWNTSWLISLGFVVCADIMDLLQREILAGIGVRWITRGIVLLFIYSFTFRSAFSFHFY